MTKSNFQAALISALLFLTYAVPARAQGDAQVNLRVDLVAWGGPIEGLTLKGPGGAPVTAQPFRFTKSLPYSGPALMEIHQSAASAPKEAAPAEALAKIPAALAERRKKSPTLVALAELPTGATRAAVLLAPDAGGTYRAHVINCDPSKMPIGKFCVLNLSPHKIAMRLNNGADSKQLATGEGHIAAPVNNEVFYELAYERDGEWVIQENCYLAVPPEDQTLMVVLCSDSELFVSSMGSRSGYLQLVTLRRPPKEAGNVAEISKAEREAAKREADRINREMDEEAKPENRGKSRSGGKKK